MGFKVNSLYLTDGYKLSHKAMLAPGTTRLYGTWIPRSTKHAPIGIIGGAMLGAGMSDKTTETVIITNKQVNGYFIQLSDSSWFRTPYKYTKGALIDKQKLR